MLRLENWADLFKFNKTLLDDDFNRDQSLVVKAKTVSLDGCSVNINATPSSNINDLFTKHTILIIIGAFNCLQAGCSRQEPRLQDLIGDKVQSLIQRHLP